MRTSKPYKLVVPLAGRGSRMTAGGFKLPKPMLICGDRSILEWSMQSIDTTECEIEFVVREEHIRDFGMFEWLQYKFGKDIGVTKLHRETKGAIETVLAGINPDDENPLIILCPDISFTPIFKPNNYDFKTAGQTLVFKSNSPNYSYIDINDKNLVSSVWEKVVRPSNLANVGVYCFQSCKLFAEHAWAYLNSVSVKSQYNPSGEAHIAPLYNRITNSDEVEYRKIDKIHIMGTPEEFKFFEEVSFKYLAKPRAFALCSDHSGFKVKDEIKKIMEKNKIPYIDFGCYNDKDCDYNTYVETTAKFVLNNRPFFGLGICRSGQGINICANKIPGIRSALVQDEYHAGYAIKHNAANFFALSAHDFPETRKLEDVIYSLTEETFDGGRHQCRLMKNGN